MTTVYLYGGKAKYVGGEEQLWHSPKPGSTHKIICFIVQQASASEEGVASLEVAKLGFTEIQLGAGKPIHVEALNDPQMEALFRRHYEGALEEGFSLVWYP